MTRLPDEAVARLTSHSRDTIGTSTQIARVMVEVDGTPRGGWTDGYRMVLVDGDPGAYDRRHKWNEIALPPVVSKWFTIDVDSLRAFAAIPPCAACNGTEKAPCACGGKSKKCRECNGTGEHECYCSSCRQEDCEECLGSGKIGCDNRDCVKGLVPCMKCRGPAVARFGVACLDLRLFGGGILDGASGEIGVRVGGPLEPVLFQCSGWTLVVMPIRWDGDGQPEAPMAETGRAA